MKIKDSILKSSSEDTLLKVQVPFSWMPKNNSGVIDSPLSELLKHDPDFNKAKLVGQFLGKKTKLFTGVTVQTDLMPVIKLSNGEYCIVIVENDLKNSFCTNVSEWNEGSEVKNKQLESLCGLLGLMPEDIGGLHYPLLEKVAIAVHEAVSLRCNRAILFMHCFDNSDWKYFNGFTSFAHALGISITPEIITAPKSIAVPDTIPLPSEYTDSCDGFMGLNVKLFEEMDRVAKGKHERVDEVKLHLAWLPDNNPMYLEVTC